MMPYTHYRAMSDEDLASVIVYLRSLPAVRHELPKTEIIFPVNYLIRSVPEPVTSPVSEGRTRLIQSSMERTWSIWQPAATVTLRK